MVCQISSFFNRVILVAIHVAGSGNSRPVDLRRALLDLTREPPRCFRDDFERPNYRVNRLSVRTKRGKIESAQ